MSFTLFVEGCFTATYTAVILVASLVNTAFWEIGERSSLDNVLSVQSLQDLGTAEPLKAALHIVVIPFKGLCSQNPALLARRAQPGFVPLVVGAAGLADVVQAVQALALRVEQEGEGRAASDAAVLVESVLLGQDGASAAFLCQLLLHFTQPLLLFFPQLHVPLDHPQDVLSLIVRQA